jgi:hypothetical protein
MGWDCGRLVAYSDRTLFFSDKWQGGKDRFCRG